MFFPALARSFVLILTSLLLLPLLPSASSGMTVESYVPYQGQVSCDPGAKPGTVGLSKLLMGKFGGGSSGISRACHIGGVSEHKEGRAFDWRLNANRKSDRMRAKKAIEWLTEEVRGVEAYRAKSLGVMYVIWDRKMWRTYDIERGWDTYDGASPHRDHMHISLSWSGARKLTSHWTSSPVFDYGPCQKWVGEMAPRAKGARLEPCPTPLIRPKANHRGYYRAQEGETVARVARWFKLDPVKLRRWNAWPREGFVQIEVGQRIIVEKETS